MAENMTAMNSLSRLKPKIPKPPRPPNIRPPQNQAFPLLHHLIPPLHPNNPSNRAQTPKLALPNRPDRVRPLDNLQRPPRRPPADVQNSKVDPRGAQRLERDLRGLG